VDSIEALASAAARDGQSIRMVPGTYAMADYFTEVRVRLYQIDYPEGPGRQPRWMLRFAGNDNTFDLTGVTLEIHTDLYDMLPRGYDRCLFIDGSGNTLRGLTIRNVGPADQGSNGNTLSIFGDDNTLEDVSVYVRGSRPYGYGDLLGKGGPRLTGLEKQSGVMIAGRNNTLRGCRVISRAFGHCFYIQQPDGMVTENILLENCYAEGVMRTTNDMLADPDGIAAEPDYRSVAENRDGRFVITSGYTKSLVEDGFRTYGGVGNVTLRNCIAVNTRAGFEIGGTEDTQTRTVLENCQALGTERGFLIGSNVMMRNCRADLKYGPPLYLRQNTVGADLELEIITSPPQSTVHALATIAGRDHRVRFYTQERGRPVAALPIMLGFKMPAHAEMMSPITPIQTSGVTVINELPRAPVIVSDTAEDCEMLSSGAVVKDSSTRSLGEDARGAWPKDGIAR
jgi:hypothetical protein